MAHLMPIVLLTVCIVFSNIFLTTSYPKMRLLPVGTKTEINSYQKTVNFSCAFLPGLSLSNQTMNCDMEVFREVKEIRATAAYYTVAMNKVVPAALVKRSLNLCFFIRHPKTDRLANVVYNYIKERSNLPLRCPVVPGTYYIHNMRLSDVPIPSLFPESEFMLEEIYRSELRRELLIEFRLYGKLVRFIETH